MDTVSEILWLLRMTINIQRIDKVQQFCSTSHDPLQCIVTNSYFHGVEVENCRIYRWCSRQMFWLEYIKTTRSIRFNVHLLLFSLYCLKPEKYIFTKYLNKKMLFWCKKNCPFWYFLSTGNELHLQVGSQSSTCTGKSYISLGDSIWQKFNQSMQFSCSNRTSAG